MQNIFSYSGKFKDYGLWVVLVLILTGTFQGCIPQKETVILQTTGEVQYAPLENITDRYYLQPNDYLFIQVSTPDPKVSEFFNAQRIGGGNMVGTQNFFYYLVDDSMHIDFPYVGTISLQGCNLRQAKIRIGQALDPLLKEYSLIVKLATNTFTALGEVARPGLHTMNKEQLTIFEAIAMAGDFKVYGKRKDVKLLRKTPAGTQTYTVDLTSLNIVNSEYYYVYPNDVIYVRPMKAKSWGIGESISFGLVTSVLALAFTIRSFVY